MASAPPAAVVVSVADTEFAPLVVQAVAAEPLDEIAELPAAVVDVASVLSSSQYSLPAVAIVASEWKCHCRLRRTGQSGRVIPRGVWPFGEVC